MDSWSRGAAVAYDETFARLCEGSFAHVIDRVPRGSHSTLLDVGAGTGRFSAAAAVRGFEVTPVDPDPAMLEVARSRAPDQGVTWMSGEAPTLPFDDATFDHAVASFVVNHVPRPRDTVRDIARVVAPGGSVTMTIWGSGPSELSRLWAAALSADGVRPVEPERVASAEDFARSPDGLAALARDCRLQVDEATTVAWTWVVDPLDLWTAPANGLAGIGRVVSAQAADVRDRIFDRYWEAAHATSHDDGLLHLVSEAVVVVGRVLGGSPPTSRPSALPPRV